MRFLVDESVGPLAARWLRKRGREVFSVFDEARGTSDDEILTRAFAGGWILVTGDLDFGEMIFKQKRPHRGVVLLRLQNQRTRVKLQVLERLLERYEDRLAGSFAVVTETQVRVARDAE